MATTKTNTHADPPLGSRWAQMWAYMWAEQLVIFWYMLPKVTHPPKVYANTKPKSLHNNNDKDEQSVNKVMFLHCGA